MFSFFKRRFGSNSNDDVTKPKVKQVKPKKIPRVRTKAEQGRRGRRNGDSSGGGSGGGYYGGGDGGCGGDGGGGGGGGGDGGS